MSAHTLGPWADYEAANGDADPTPYRIDSSEGDAVIVAWVERAEDAARIVACVNACDGYGDPVGLIRDAALVLANGSRIGAERDTLKQQRNELAAMLAQFVAWRDDPNNVELPPDDEIRAAIAKVRP